MYTTCLAASSRKCRWTVFVLLEEGGGGSSGCCNKKRGGGVLIVLLLSWVWIWQQKGLGLDRRMEGLCCCSFPETPPFCAAEPDRRPNRSLVDNDGALCWWLHEPVCCPNYSELDLYHQSKCNLIPFIESVENTKHSSLTAGGAFRKLAKKCPDEGQ